MRKPNALGDIFLEPILIFLNAIFLSFFFLIFLMQNLREAIAGYRNSIHRQADEKKRESALYFFVEYLERYYFLICFAVYIHTDQSALFSHSSEQGSFQDWMKARPELYSILRRCAKISQMHIGVDKF